MNIKPIKNLTSQIYQELRKDTQKAQLIEGWHDIYDDHDTEDNNKTISDLEYSSQLYRNALPGEGYFSVPSDIMKDYPTKRESPLERPTKKEIPNLSSSSTPSFKGSISPMNLPTREIPTKIEPNPALAKTRSISTPSIETVKSRDKLKKLGILK